MRWTVLFLFFSRFLLFSLAKPDELPRAIIHIGPHKTGSSFLQYNLVKNKREFEQKGFSVLMETGKSGISFAHTLASLVGQKARKDKFNKTDLDSVVDRIKVKNNPIIFSSEAFDTFGEKAIHSLGDILKGYDVTIVAYHREKTSHLRSMWSERNKKSSTPTPFSSWVDHYLPSSYSTPSVIDLFGTIDRYAKVFGKEAIRLVSFEGSLANSDPFEVFVKDVVGLPFDSFHSYTETTNPSPSSLLIHFVSIANRLTRFDCEFPSFLSKVLKEKIRKFPQTCSQLTGWQTLLGIHDRKFFQKYGEPLYLPQDLANAAVICAPDVLTILSHPSHQKSFFSSLRRVCYNGTKTLNNRAQKFSNTQKKIR